MRATGSAANDTVLGALWLIGSCVFFASMNFDRLYLGKVAALELLGVYGIARTFSELVNSLILRLSATLIFPIVAAGESQEPSVAMQPCGGKMSYPASL